MQGHVSALVLGGGASTLDMHPLNHWHRTEEATQPESGPHGLAAAYPGEWERGTVGWRAL